MGNYFQIGGESTCLLWWGWYNGYSVPGCATVPGLLVTGLGGKTNGMISYTLLRNQALRGQPGQAGGYMGLGVAPLAARVTLAVSGSLNGV